MFIKNQSGFSILHILPMIAIVAVIAVIGVKVMQPSHAATPVSCYFSITSPALPRGYTKYAKISMYNYSGRSIVNANGVMLMQGPRTVQPMGSGLYIANGKSAVSYPGITNIAGYAGLYRVSGWMQYTFDGRSFHSVTCSGSSTLRLN